MRQPVSRRAGQSGGHAVRSAAATATGAWPGLWKTLRDSLLWGQSFVLEFPGLCLSGVTSCTTTPVFRVCFLLGEECCCFLQSTSASGTERHPPRCPGVGVGERSGAGVYTWLSIDSTIVLNINSDNNFAEVLPTSFYSLLKSSLSLSLWGLA